MAAAAAPPHLAGHHCITITPLPATHQQRQHHRNSTAPFPSSPRTFTSSGHHEQQRHLLLASSSSARHHHLPPFAPPFPTTIAAPLRSRFAPLYLLHFHRSNQTHKPLPPFSPPPRICTLCHLLPHAAAMETGAPPSSSATISTTTQQQQHLSTCNRSRKLRTPLARTARIFFTRPAPPHLQPPRPPEQPPLSSAAQPREEGGRGRNPNSGESVLCATCQHLIGSQLVKLWSNWSIL